MANTRDQVAFSVNTKGLPMRLLTWLKSKLLGTPEADLPPWQTEVRAGLEHWQSQMLQLLSETFSHLQNQETALAQSCCERLEQLLERLAEGESDAHSRYLRAMVLFDHGLNYAGLANLDRSEQALRSALGLCQEFANEFLGDPYPVERSAACLNHLGLLAQARREFDQSIDLLHQAREIRTELLERHPEDNANRVYLGGILCNLGNTESMRQNHTEALSWYGQSIEALDSIIPGCQCGCRDMFAQMTAHMTGDPSWLMTAHQFLGNALRGRADTLEASPTTSGRRYFESDPREDFTIVKIVRAELPSNHEGPSATPRPLDEYKWDLLELAYTESAPFVLDLTDIDSIDADVAALFVHLQERVTGMGEEVLLVGLPAAGDADWRNGFTCYARLDEALADLEWTEE